MTDKYKTSSGQVQDKFGTSTPTSTPQVPDKLHTENPNIKKLILAVGEKELSEKEIMNCLGLMDIYVCYTPKRPATRARNICLPPRDKHFIKQ